MEKICLIKAGDYLLGIDTSVILKKQEINSFIAEEQSDEISLILLTSLFDKHASVFPEPKGFILEVKSTVGSQILVVDSCSAKIIEPEYCESLPLLYPDLARICCPQILIHEDQPVLLLDTDGLETVLASLKTDVAVISVATLRKHGSREKKILDTPSVAALNDATFNSIVSWTIAEFLERGSDEDCVITPDELLLQSIPHGELQGLSDDLLQGLIDKTVQECGKFHNTAMQRLRQTIALTNS